MKSKKQTLSSSFTEKENTEQNELQHSLSRRSFMKQSIAASAGVVAAPNLISPPFQGRTSKPAIKITDLKCAIIANSPVVRITTDAGINGYGQAETSKPYLKPFVLFFKDYLVGEDPTNVERILLKIRRMGSFKPWGSAVSAIEIALWDIAGKAANLPVYKLMGGKIRDRVRAYTGGGHYERTGSTQQDWNEWGARIKASPEGFSIIKMGLGFHTNTPTSVPNFYYGNVNPSASPKNVAHYHRGPISVSGLNYMIDYVATIKEAVGDSIGVAYDCGPGFMLSDAIRLARALEPYNVMWLEDMLTGDYTPYVMADDYRELTQSTSTPIHTGEQIYLRQHFRELIEKHAVRIIGPDPEDVGGIAELKWVAEYADLHSIQMAPHGVFDGLIGIAAQVQVGAAMPENYIAFEYCWARPEWWYEIIEGLPDPLVKDGQIEVWDRPGLGVEINVKAARQYLAPEDKNFFD